LSLSMNMSLSMGRSRNVPGTSWERSGNVPGTSWERSGNVPGTSWERSGNVPGTSWERSGNVPGTFCSFFSLYLRVLSVDVSLLNCLLSHFATEPSEMSLTSSKALMTDWMISTFSSSMMAIRRGDIVMAELPLIAHDSKIACHVATATDLETWAMYAAS